MINPPAGVATAAVATAVGIPCSSTPYRWYFCTLCPKAERPSREGPKAERPSREGPSREGPSREGPSLERVSSGRAHSDDGMTCARRPLRARTAHRRAAFWPRRRTPGSQRRTPDGNCGTCPQTDRTGVHRNWPSSSSSPQIGDPRRSGRFAVSHGRRSKDDGGSVGCALTSRQERIAG